MQFYINQRVIVKVRKAASKVQGIFWKIGQKECKSHRKSWNEVELCP